MSRVSRFRVLGQLDMAGAPVLGTVEIDRDAGTYAVRPLRRRRVYALPMSVVATMVCRAIVRAEAAEKRAKSGRRRKVGRRKP